MQVCPDLRIGKENESALDGVMAALVRHGYVSIEGEKVSYTFSGAD